MTKAEAIEAMKTHRVRHNSFTEEEWVTQCSNGDYYFEDGYSCSPDEFWRYRYTERWDDGWEIITE